MDAPNHSGTRVLLWPAAIAGLLAGLAGAFMWASEPWQRPLKLIGVADATWFVIALLGFATAVVAWSMRGGRRWGWRAAPSTALCAAVLIGFLHARRAATVEALLDHDVVMKIITPGFDRPDSTAAWKQYAEEGFDYVIRPLFGISPKPSPIGLIGTGTPDAYDHLLETCRWPTRRAFIQEIIGDESRTRLATYDWHRLFPAVIGQDVTLAHRIELLDWLGDMTASASWPDACHDAATFWMALIVLTDAEAFADWGDRTLTLMLANQDPPLSLTGDVWIRAIDMLVALTPEEHHAERIEPMTKDPTLLRRALRQRVRGMEYHAAAIIREIELLDEHMDRRSAAAMWVDLKRIANASGDEGVAREIHAWLGSRLERWLMNETKVALEYFSDSQSYYHDRLMILIDGVINKTLPGDSKHRLAERARAALDAVVYPPQEEEKFPDECTHALFIAALLDDDVRIAIHNQTAMLMAKRIPHFVSSGRSGWSELNMTARALKFVMNDLHVETREFLKKTLIEWFVFHEKTNRSFGRMFVETAVVLDMTSEDPILSGAEQIAVGAFINHYGGSVPQYSPEAVEEFIRIVVSGEKPLHLDEWFGAVTRRLEKARSTADDMQADHIRYLAVLYGMIGPEHSPADLMVMLRAHGMKWIQGLAKHPELFSKLMERSDFVRELLAGIDLTKHRDYHVLIEYLKNHPPPQEVRQIILQYMERQVESPDRDVRLTAFHWLMFFSDWFDEEDRAAFRGRFHRFFETERPSLDAWSLRYIHHYRSDLGRILMHRGEQVAWEEDALSAAYSWSSEIHHDLAIFPWSDYQSSSIFRHLLASSCLFTPPGWGEAELVPVLMDDIAPNRAFHDPFPTPLIEVTPWQRARSLHLRRPDLKIPGSADLSAIGKTRAPS